MRLNSKRKLARIFWMRRISASSTWKSSVKSQPSKLRKPQDPPFHWESFSKTCRSGESKVIRICDKNKRLLKLVKQSYKSCARKFSVWSQRTKCCVVFSLTSEAVKSKWTYLRRSISYATNSNLVSNLEIKNVNKQIMNRVFYSKKSHRWSPSSLWGTPQQIKSRTRWPKFWTISNTSWRPNRRNWLLLRTYSPRPKFRR